MTWNELSPTVKILALLASAHPEALDRGHPHGAGRYDPGEEVFLNPQPLPPVELAAAAARMSHRIATLAVEADLRNESPASWVSEVIDDWCGTYWPRKWPWPGPGPGPEDGPQPQPWSISMARLSGAAVFASVAARLGEGELSQVMARGAERLAEAAVA